MKTLFCILLFGGLSCSPANNSTKQLPLYETTTYIILANQPRTAGLIFSEDPYTVLASLDKATRRKINGLYGQPGDTVWVTDRRGGDYYWSHTVHLVQPEEEEMPE